MECGKCKYWNKKTDGYYPNNFNLGKCTKVMLFWDATEWEKPDYERRVLTKEVKDNKAFVQDGSDYKAELITLSNFGCVQFEQI